MTYEQFQTKVQELEIQSKKHQKHPNLKFYLSHYWYIPTFSLYWHS